MRRAPGEPQAPVGGLWAVASDDLPQHDAKAVDVHGHGGCPIRHLLLLFSAAAAQLRHQLRRDVPRRSLLHAGKRVPLKNDYPLPQFCMRSSDVDPMPPTLRCANAPSLGSALETLVYIKAAFDAVQIGIRRAFLHALQALQMQT